jgi:ferrous iron transport protein B
MADDRRLDGTPVWTPAVAISLLVWFVIAMQCMSTLAIVRRETGGWTWPLAQLAGMNLLAWVMSFAAYRLALLVWP